MDLFNYVSLLLPKTKMTRHTVSITELWEEQEYLIIRMKSSQAHQLKLMNTVH